jgi:predicted anti-sigma-YlaC factor YlaD
MNQVANNFNCRSEDVAAYLDGELDASACSIFEQHLKECTACSSALREQRHLLCTLDLALGCDPHVDLPKNFAEVVAVHAQSDMRGVRRSIEHKRALRVCLALSLISFALLGGAALSDFVLAPSRTFIKPVFSLFGFLWHALYDAGAGLCIILRAVSRHLLLESHALALLGFLLLVTALALLPRLISRYHRTRITD